MNHIKDVSACARCKEKDVPLFAKYRGGAPVLLCADCKDHADYCRVCRSYDKPLVTTRVGPNTGSVCQECKDKQIAESDPIVVFTCRFPRSLHSRLEGYARRNSMTPSAFIRQAVARHLDRVAYLSKRMDELEDEMDEGLHTDGGGLTSKPV